MSLSSNHLAPVTKKQMTLINLKNHFQNYYMSSENLTPVNSSGVRSDFARLGRRLLSKSLGLVLGGGGARGISHVGIIRAFEEVGIPFDMVGGCSIGAFVGGLYARNSTHVSIYGRTKLLSSRITSPWRSLIDLTYPITALFTGHEFNRGIWKCFSDTLIEDCWLPYFAMTTNITMSRSEIHTSGYIWRYVRASMSLSGFVPPLCDKGNLLMDGGYVNNVPADIMRQMGADKIVAVDVGVAEDTSPVNYGDSLSGWWVMLCRLNPFRPALGRIPELSDIQSRIAYVSSVKHLEDVKKLPGCYYLHPPISKFAIMEFGKFKEIEELGYQYGKKIVAQWIKTGELQSVFGVKPDEPTKETHVRRASI
jgi:lysophospholipid hydrolase